MIRVHRPQSQFVFRVAFASLVAIAMFIVGCRSESASSLVVERRMDVRPSGEIVYTHKVNGRVTSVTTENPAAPTTQAVTEQGVYASVAGEQVKTSRDFAAETSAWVYGIGGIVLTVAAGVVWFVGKQWMFAAPLAIGAAVCFAYQTLQSPLVGYGLVLILPIAIWYSLRRSKRLKAGKPVTTATDSTEP